jgi:hypothetical protein
MVLGEDFTSKKDYWEQLVPLTTINDKKIVRLDATISGVHFKDIVTNAADPVNLKEEPAYWATRF